VVTSLEQSPIRALLTHGSNETHQGSGVTERNTNTKLVGDVLLDCDAYVVVTDVGRARLTRSEFAVLNLLMSRPERVYSYREIAECYAGEGYLVTESAVRVMVHRVRKKLGDAGSQLQSMRGVGFYLAEST
jgi:DNA-binding response OmpR family regulator